MRWLLLFFFSISHLYSDFETASLISPPPKGIVGEEITISFLLPSQTFSAQQIANVLIKSPFFDTTNGLATLKTVLFDKKKNTLTLILKPKCQGQHLVTLPSISLKGTTLLWPIFQYTCTPPPIPSEPWLDISLKPVPTIDFSTIDTLTNQLLEKQRDGFIQRENLIASTLQTALFLMLFFVGASHFKPRLLSWLHRYQQHKKRQAMDLSLLRALRDQTTNWPLLHQRLVAYVAQKSGKQEEMTAEQLACYFQEKKQPHLAQSAELIGQYAYLPTSDYTPFQEAVRSLLRRG